MRKPHGRIRGPRSRFAALAILLVLAAGCAAPAPAPPEPAPPLRDPLFRVSSIRILRDRLVTTELRLGLEIENPNDLPLVLESCAWSLEAEGRPWVSGRLGGAEEPLIVPANAKTLRQLDVELNFADSDRRLFDLIASLGRVSYRLRGEARLYAGAASAIPLVARFDVAGSCAVER